MQRAAKVVRSQEKLNTKTEILFHWSAEKSAGIKITFEKNKNKKNVEKKKKSDNVCEANCEAVSKETQIKKM